MRTTETLEEYLDRFRNRYSKLGEVRLGSSTLIESGEFYVATLSKKKNWKREPERIAIAISGVGGNAEPGETPYRTLVREIREESGLGEHDYVTANANVCAVIDLISSKIFEVEFTKKGTDPSPFAIYHRETKNIDGSSIFLALCVYETRLVDSAEFMEKIIKHGEESIPGYLAIPRGSIERLFNEGAEFPVGDLVRHGISAYLRNADDEAEWKKAVVYPQFTPMAYYRYLATKKK